MAAVTMLLALPLAIASQALGQNAPDIVVHLVLGTGMLIFAKAVFDFGLPRWINWVGALSAGAFGVVFLLQALSSLLPENAALDDIAYGLLGDWPERSLVLGIDVWFLGLLLLGTEGKTRLIGWALIPILTGYHLISAAGALLAIDVPNLGVFSLLLPFVWLLIEGAKNVARRQPWEQEEALDDQLGSPRAIICRPATARPCSVPLGLPVPLTNCERMARLANMPIPPSTREEV